jgi:hypothetical protein
MGISKLFPARRFLLLVFLSLIFTVLKAQIRIKERVEIESKAKTSIYQSGPLEVRLYWNGSGSHIPGQDMELLFVGDNLNAGYNPSTNTVTDANEYIKKILYEDDTSFSGVTSLKCFASSGSYWIYAILPAADSNFNTPYVEIIREGLDTTFVPFYNPTWSSMNTQQKCMWTYYDYPGEESCYGVNIEIREIADIQYGESRVLSPVLVDGCRNPIYNPPSTFFRIELVGDSLGTLWDAIKGKGVMVIDSVTDLSTGFYYDALGIEPETAKNLTLRVSTYDGSIPPAERGFTLIPSEVKAELERTEISFGDITTLKIKVRQPNGIWMEKPPEWNVTYNVFQSSESGFLYNMDSSVVNNYYMQDYSSQVNYASYPDTTQDSVEVIIQIHANEPCSDCIILGSIQRDPAGFSSGASLGRKKYQKTESAQSIKRGRIQPIVRIPKQRTASRINMYDHFGFLKLLVKKEEILLGKTNYYQARLEKGNLIIEEVSGPALNGGIAADVWQNDPVQVFEKSDDEVVYGKRLGVYWEKEKPVYETGNPLPKGLIRLVGRYWTQDSTYKVRLTAKYGNQEATTVIEVKKPNKLGDGYYSEDNNGNRTKINEKFIKDVLNHTYDPNLDAIIIRYAGLYGIPPQVIKGDIQKESTFQPGYRYEPFVNIDFQMQKNPTSRFLDDDFRYLKISTSDGNPGIPTDHSNVHDCNGQLISYPIKGANSHNYTIWEMLFNCSKLLNPNATNNLYPITLWYRNGAIDGWNDHYYEIYSKLDDNSNDQAAVDYANAWLKDEYQKGIMSECTAQTRSIASYGLMQVMYTTAVTERNYPFERIGGTLTHLPEYLNLTDTSLTYGIQYLNSKINEELKEEGDGIGKLDNWTLGYERTIIVGLNMYNGKSSLTKRYNWFYGFKVLSFSEQYKPQN